jgi:hypothetical protein
MKILFTLSAMTLVMSRSVLAEEQAAWVLVTVTEAGEVHISNEVPGMHQCAEARSVALTGMSIEEKDKRDKEQDADREKSYAEFRATHPGHPPETTPEFDALRDLLQLDSNFETMPVNGPVTFTSAGYFSFEYAARDMLIYKGRETTSTSTAYFSLPHDIRYAVCAPSDQAR